MRLSLYAEYADPDLSIFKDRTEELLAFLQRVLATLAFRYVFRQTDNVLRLAVSIPNQPEPPVANHDAAITANEALLVFVCVSLPLDELRISPRTRETFILRNNLIPLFQASKLFSGVTQHFLERFVGDMFLA